MSPDGGAIEAMDRAFTALAIARNEPLVARHVGRDMPITLGFTTMQGALTALDAFLAQLNQRVESQYHTPQSAQAQTADQPEVQAPAKPAAMTAINVGNALARKR